jgi:two-component system, NarL family, nitrate/nitrite response regulator NarL
MPSLRRICSTGSASNREQQMANDIGLELVIADAQPFVAEGVAALAEAAGHHVRARVQTREALIAALAAAPDAVAIVDEALACGGGGLLGLLGGGRQLILMVADAGRASPPEIAGMALAGVLAKSDGPDRLVACLATVARGLRSPTAGASPGRRRLRGAAALLTPRERDIVRLVSIGQRNRAIADRLGISEGTVKMHLHNVYAKLGIESRTQLATDARLRVL